MVMYNGAPPSSGGAKIGTQNQKPIRSSRSSWEAGPIRSVCGAPRCSVTRRPRSFSVPGPRGQHIFIIQNIPKHSADTSPATRVVCGRESADTSPAARSLRPRAPRGSYSRENHPRCLDIAWFQLHKHLGPGIFKRCLYAVFQLHQDLPVGEPPILLEHSVFLNTCPGFFCTIQCCCRNCMLLQKLHAAAEAACCCRSSMFLQKLHVAKKAACFCRTCMLLQKLHAAAEAPCCCGNCVLLQKLHVVAGAACCWRSSMLLQKLHAVAV